MLLNLASESGASDVVRHRPLSDAAFVWFFFLLIHLPLYQSVHLSTQSLVTSCIETTPCHYSLFHGSTADEENKQSRFI